MFFAWVVCAGSLVTVATDQAASAGDLAAYETARENLGHSPEAHVDLALWCEAHGLMSERLKQLSLAILMDPKSATARGLMGLVAFRGHWQRPDAVAEKVKADETLAAASAEYNDRRGRTPNTADAQWKLALWCEEHGLKAEESAHLTSVVRLDPSNEAAWKRLGCVRHSGRWMTAAEIKAEAAELERQKHANRAWKPRLEKLRSSLTGAPSSRAAAEESLRAVNDPRAVPAIWSLFAIGDAGLQKIAVQMFGNIDAPAASRALEVLAFSSTSDEVRRIATETLARRDPRDFVGLAIRRLRDPIKYQVRPANGVGPSMEVFVEGKRFNIAHLYRAPILPEDTRRALANPALLTVVTPQDISMFSLPATSWETSNDPSTFGSSQFATLFARRERALQQNLAAVRMATLSAQQQLAAEVAAIDGFNEALAETNQRALFVLTHVTGQDLGNESASWQRWWTDQQGYAFTSPEATNKPTIVQSVPLAFTPSYGRVLSPPPPHTSCFGAGTVVRTLSGRRPIESIRVGDQVIAQDLRSGALSFQPVVAVYHNPPNATLRITMNLKSVVATGIHRFWKSGQGWVMARDLKPGDTLRTLGGTATVASVKADTEQPVFNLEVASDRSFFVGDVEALVHDNSTVLPVTEPFDASHDLAHLTSTP